MKDAAIVTRHDVSPDAAIGILLNHSGVVLLDLDETLYLRNSTEDFIDCARPQLAALLLLRALELLRPWCWTGGVATRDVWRVNLIRGCFPLTLRRWRERIPRLAAEFANRRLLAALPRPGLVPVVTTAGFHVIVTPLVAALGLSHERIIAARLSGFADRRAGKLAMVADALGGPVLRRALVLTDSSQDLALLDACARPLRAVWPDAHFREAFSGAYLPGRYLNRIKRPGERYIARGILQEDFAFWVLSSIALAASPVTHVLGLVFLLASFWIIYELGYVDNDRIAQRFEAHPKLSAAFAKSTVATPRWEPWIWSCASALIAIWLLRWPLAPGLADGVGWLLVLLATHGWFHLYNRFDKATRVWLFVGLQFARAAAFVSLVPVVPAGALALAAHVLAKWVPYCFYRVAGADWVEVPIHLIRLLFFLVLALLLACAEGATVLFSASMLALLGWNLYRARSELAAVVSRANRLDHPRHEAAP